MKKKIAAVVAAVLVAVLAFAACSGGGDPANYKPGTIDGNTYESEWMGLRFESDSMTMASQEEMQAQMDASSELTGVDATPSVTCEMIASDATGVPNVNIMCELLSVNIDEEGYAEVSKQNLEAMEDFTYVCGETTDAELGGVPFKAFDGEMSMNGTSVYQRMYCMKKDGYMVTVTMTALDKSGLDSMADYFTAY